jgi:predicted unusual protein kinase regulating ubiquinone biosynthesis (AarF/ABC1/UbiB family)
MTQPATSIPTGRLRRTAKVGGLLGGEVVRSYATRATNLRRSPKDRRDADGRRRLQAASHVVEVLGQMKGPAMKVGQMASVWDLWGLPPDEQEQLQAKLGELRDQAPQVAFTEMRTVIEHDLEDRIENLFAEFDPDAAAAASIGQVYRARLHDGREVAVKVQYPHVAGTVRADLQNLGLVLRAAKRFAPGLDPASVASELRERISEELDYEHEAQAQRAFARQWRGHPFIVVPNVITSLGRARVLVTEWVDGLGFEQIKLAPQTHTRPCGGNRHSILLRLALPLRPVLRRPPAGNFLLLPDGKVAFLDFGMTKQVPRSRVTAELAVLRAALEQDAQGTHAGLAALGFFERDDPRFDPSHVLDHVHALNAWYAHDETLTLTPQYISSLLAHAGDPRSPYWDLMRNETLPAESLLASRMQAMTLAGVGQLSATANWHRIMSEWICGSPPSSALGIAEAEFFAARGLASKSG